MFDSSGLPLIAYRNTGFEEVRLARFDGATWTSETVHQGDPALSLALDGSGNPALGFLECGRLNYASVHREGRLYRGTVATLAPGWKAAALPLTSGNDDDTAPFPKDVRLPGTETDALATTAPLVLYRIPDTNGQPMTVSLQAVKAGGGIELHF